MAKQWFIPGLGMVDETGTDEYFIPGMGMIDESSPSGPPPAHGYGPNFLIGGTPDTCQHSSTNNAFDGNWGSEFEHSNFPHWLTYDLGVGVAKAPTKLTLRGGLWGPGENPKTFTLEGSDTGVFGGEETVLLTVADAGWSASYEFKEWTFVNTTAFRYFRLNMTASQSGTVWCEVVEMCLFEESIYGVNICTGGTPLAKSEISPHEIDKAFDDDPSTFYESNAETSWWLQYELATAKVVAELVLTSCDSMDAFPKDFTLQASNTGAFAGEEATLLTVTGASGIQGHQAQAWPVTNSTPYKFYRVNVTAVSWGNYVDLAEVTLHESLTPPPASLVIQDLTLVPSLDNVVLTAKGVLTIQDLTLAPSIDNLVLTATQGGGSGNMFLVL
jgi:hypothetical protein